MLAVVYERPGHFEVREVPDPTPAPGEVLIRVLQTGLCGTDLHVDQDEYVVTYPLTPGHEVVGVVHELGAGAGAGAGVGAGGSGDGGGGHGVGGIHVGQQVTVNPNLPCGHCANCRRGRRIMCTEMSCLGITRAGGFAEFVVAPIETVFPAPGLDPDVAVFVEPASCAMHGLETAAVRPGSTALVFGTGPTGVFLAQLLVHGGAGHVTAADSSAFKLERARAFGIDATVLVDRDDPTASELALRGLAPDGFDLVVEATGSVAVGERCVALTRSGGTVLVYGVTAPDATVSFHPYEVFRREITIKGSFAEIDSFPSAIRAISTGRVHTEGLITHRFPLTEYAQALQALRTDPTVHKVVVHP